MIDANEINKEDRHVKILEALKESAFQETLNLLSWDSDLHDDDDENKFDDFIEELAEVVLKYFPNIATLSLSSTMLEDKKRRNKLR